MTTIYGSSLLTQVLNSFGAHKEDIKFAEIFTIYGLYFSDHNALTPVETKAVVYASISCLGLPGPGDWHLSMYLLHK